MLFDMLRNDNKCDGDTSLVKDDEKKEREEEDEEVTPMLWAILDNNKNVRVKIRVSEKLSFLFSSSLTIDVSPSHLLSFLNISNNIGVISSSPSSLFFWIITKTFVWKYEYPRFYHF